MVPGSWRFRWGLLLTLLLAIGWGSRAVAVTPPAAAHKTYTVKLSMLQFEPQTLTVHVGDRVTWRNNNIVAHTATAEDGGFDSKDIQPRHSWTMTARHAGTFPYICALHPNMHAKLIVLK